MAFVNWMNSLPHGVAGCLGILAGLAICVPVMLWLERRR